MGWRILAALALIVLVLGPSTGAWADPDGYPDRMEADLTYRLGLDAAGATSGTCDAAALFLNSGPAGTSPTVVLGSNGVLTHHMADVNITYAYTPDGGWVYHVTDGNLQHVPYAINATTVEILPHEDARIDVYGSPALSGTNSGTFTAGFDASRLAITAPKDFLVAAPTYVMAPDGPSAALTANAPIPQGNSLAGPIRSVEGFDGLINATGNLTVYVQDVDISWGGEKFQLGAWETVMQDLPPGFYAGTRWIRVQWATLEVDDGFLEVATERGSLACRAMTASIEGVVNAYQASGTVRSADQVHDFDLQELTIQGNLEWEDEPDQGYARAIAAGEFTAVGLDFAPVHKSGGGIDVPTVGLWASVLAAATAVLYFGVKGAFAFFTRFRQTQLLQHSTRRVVLDAVEANPNINLRTLVERCGVSKSEVRYHAHILESWGLIRSYKVHRDRCFVAKSTIKQEGRRAVAPKDVVVAKNDPSAAVARQVASEQSLRLTSLLARVRSETNLSRAGAWKAVTRAERYGWVRRVERGKEVWIECA